MAYTANDIVDKTLYAKKKVNAKKYPTDDAPVLFTIQPGEIVGVVYSYLMPVTGRSKLHWQFQQSDGTSFYTEHDTGRYDLEKLREQGLQTITEKDLPTPSIWDRIFTKGPLTGGINTTLNKVILLIIVLFAALTLWRYVLPLFKK